MSAVANCIAWTFLELALAAIAPAATPPPEVIPLKVAPAPPGFTAMNPAETGVTFTNELDSWTSVSNRVLNNGSGVAAGDFDGDGRVDLFFCSLNQQNRLFRNRGNWQFEDVTAQAGLRFPPLFYRAAVFADIDGDGWLDLLVGTVGQGVLCFLNDQHGHFKDVTASANTTNAFGTETLALADVDGNGTLDLYVANNRTDDTRDWPRIPVMYVNKKPTVPQQLRNRLTFENGVVQEFGEPDTLYLNDGRGHFSAVPWTNGVFLDENGAPLTNAPMDWGLAAGFRDLNGDGAPDLYVCNDYWTPDRMWLNDGRGHFRAVGALAWRKMPASSMGVDFADIDRDGWVDIFAVDMRSRSSELRRRQTVAKRARPVRIGDLETRVQTPRNTLLWNRGDGTYAEIACFAGVEASDWSWSPVFLDVDLDGYEDLLITAGHLRDIQDFDANDRIRAQQESWRRSPMAATNLQRAFVEARHEHARFYPPLNLPVVAYHNLGHLQFEERTTDWGLNIPGVNHGIVTADLDNDGDLDLVINRLGAPALLLRNNSGAPRVAVRLRGRPPNTQAIGAKVELFGGPVSNHIHEVTCGGRYLSGPDPLCVFACGGVSNGLRLKVTWRGGGVTELPNVAPNHLYILDEAASTKAPAATPTRPPASPLFEDVSFLLRHVHQDAPFDDFLRQPLLPRKLSQAGPGVAWFDLDGDGWDDLMIGAGQGGRRAVFYNQQGKAFRADTNAWSAGLLARDQTGILGWPREPGRPLVLTGLASYEDGAAGQPSGEVYEPGTGSLGAALAGHSASVGPLALADFDGDGDLDLFVGGQVLPGRYPEACDSLLFRQEKGEWILDAANTQTLTQAGVVNGAVWSDLDGDGWPDLVLACEWGPLRVFNNRAGRLTEVTAQWGLAGFTGLWQSVTAGDFDGDGRLDLIAGNWGLNSCERSSPEEPLTIFFGDLGGRGAVDILETEMDPTSKQRVPRWTRDRLAVAIPWLAERFPTHTAWSHATAAEVIGATRAKISERKAVTLATTVFLNRTGRFEAKPLPAEAQFAPAFGVAVADFDGDGHEDVFLAQNFFAFRLEDSRLEAGRGLLLRGDGRGGFAPVPGPGSGLQVDGEQRGAAVADFDQDGREDLVVTQNGAPTRLFRNRGGRPGLRVRLTGPAGNPQGVGSVLRVRGASGWGPSREIHAGSGYWSQDSSTVVLALPESVSALQVTWPGGKKTEQPLRDAPGEVVVKP